MPAAHRCLRFQQVAEKKIREGKNAGGIRLADSPWCSKLSILSCGDDTRPSHSDYQLFGPSWQPQGPVVACPEVTDDAAENLLFALTAALGSFCP